MRRSGRGAVAQAAVAVSHRGLSIHVVRRAGRPGAVGIRTTNGWGAALAAAVEDGRDQSEVAVSQGVSWPTAQRAVVVHAAVELAEQADSNQPGSRRTDRHDSSVRSWTT